MIHAAYTHILPVPPEVAFPYLSNPGNDVEWQSSCIKAELLGEVPAVGCRYNITFNFLGRKMEFIGEITTLEADHDYSFRVIEGSFYYEGRYTVTSHPEGSKIYWQFAAEPGKFFGILPASLLRKVLVSQIEKDLVALARMFSTNPVVNT